ERTRVMENVMKLTEIERRFKDGKQTQIVSSTRSVIYEGRLKMRGQNIDLQQGARVFLFDDLLLCAYPLEPENPKSLLAVKHHMSLASCYNVHVSDVHDDVNSKGESVGLEVWFQF